MPGLFRRVASELLELSTIVHLRWPINVEIFNNNNMWLWYASFLIIYPIAFGLSPTHNNSMKKPHWPLERVKELARSGKFFVQRTKAMDTALFVFTSPLEIRAAIKQVLVSLELKNYSETVELTWDIADIYGVYNAGLGWYLKITIDEELPEVAVISFHPLKRPLRTIGGMVELRSPEANTGE